MRYGGGNARGLSYRVYAKGFNRGAEVHSDASDYDRWASVQGGFRMDWVKNTRIRSRSKVTCIASEPEKLRN